MSRSPVVVRAVLAQSTLATYLQVIEWVPMFPWNDLSRGNGQERLDLVLGAASVGLIYATWRGWRIAIGAAIVAQMAWLVMQVDSWWRPYLFGATPAEARFHARWFGRTLKLLPAIDDHPVPDAAHLVLHMLIVAALAMTAMAWWRRGNP